MIPEDYEQRVTALAEQDPYYQKLLEQCRIAELQYLQVLQALPDADRQTIEGYITLCEELSHRSAQLTAEHYAIHTVPILKSL